MEMILSTLVGIPIGIFCSLVAWWILFHKFVPEVTFSENISKVTNNGTPNYRIKFKNTGKRDILDLQVFVRMYITGLNKNRPDNQKVIRLAMGIDHWPTLTVKGKAKISRIFPAKTAVFQEEVYPPEIRMKAFEGSLTLEDILDLGEESKFHIVAFAYDSFSGTRKAFVSKYYKNEDIKEGLFEKGTLNII